MPNYEATLDGVFQALANPTRRSLVHRLGRGPAAMTELAIPFKMALPSLLQHLKVLEACGLVRSRKVGRKRMFELDLRALDQAETWIEEQRRVWETRLDQLDKFLKEDQ